MAFDPKAWQRLSPWLDQALDLEGEARERWLIELSATEPELALELRSWLAGQSAVEAAGFLADQATAPGRDTLAGRRIGAYTLIESIGSGGMGSVWLAQRNDGRFEGRMAIKLLHAGLVRKALVERFRREGTILGKLSHPNIARLLDAGITADEQPYLVLEHVAGQRIDAYADEKALDVESRLRLFIQVLDAVQHAHTRLVVHRDLKPGNVMVDHSGAVKLLDFGIAKLIDEEGHGAEATELTREGGRALTPLYAAPEQTRGDPITTATDVYSLGLLLFVLLTGQHPRQNSDGGVLAESGDAPRASLVVTDITRRDEADLQHAAQRRSSTPTRLAARLGGDLDNVLAKAMRVEPGERYITAAAFSEDLRRHLIGETVSARPDSWSYRASRFVKRHKFSVGTATLALVAVCTSAVVAVHQAQVARAQEALAAEERDRAFSEQRVALSATQFLQELIGINGPDGLPMKASDLIDHGDRLSRHFFHDEPDTLSHLLEVFISKNINLNRFDHVQRLQVDLDRLAAATANPLRVARARCLRESRAGADLSEIDKAIALIPTFGSPLASTSSSICLDAKSFALSETGRHDEAAEALTQSREATRPFVGLTRLAEPGHATSLGELYSAGGQVAKAEVEFQKALEAFIAQGKAHSLDAALTHNYLSGLYASAGSPKRSVEHARKAVAAAGAGNVNSAVPHYLFIRLWTNLYSSGEWSEALRVAQGEAMRSATGTDWDSAFQELRGALVLRMQGDLDTATTRFEAGVAKFDQSTNQDRHGRALEQLIELLVEQGRFADALAHGQWAVSNLPGAARHLREKISSLMALIHFELGNVEASAELARKVLAEAPSYMPKDLPNTIEGRAHLALAKISLQKGDQATVERHARAALQHFEGSLMPTHALTQAARELVPR